ncbi:MAG TPA: hypothetical protein DCO82_04505 [Alphaproteobacteria bacterium]|nr:hypothetical protein [Alphaproteobacteria bacterium]
MRWAGEPHRLAALEHYVQPKNASGAENAPFLLNLKQTEVNSYCPCAKNHIRIKARVIKSSRCDSRIENSK